MTHASLKSKLGALQSIKFVKRFAKISTLYLTELNFKYSPIKAIYLLLYLATGLKTTFSCYYPHAASRFRQIFHLSKRPFYHTLSRELVVRI